MRPSSSRSDALLGPVFTSAEVEQQISDDALLRAMLEVEAALAIAEADAGLIPAAAAKAIAQACAEAEFDIARIGADSQAAGNPVVPLARALGAAVPESARPFVHFGATSQDILDTALMLVARRAGDIVVHETVAAAGVCARLAQEHRGTAMLARTLGQQAGVTTFGLTAARWFVALDDSAARLRQVLDTRVAAQLGGAAGNLGVLGEPGVGIASHVAGALGLADPPLPWHTDRQRVLDLAAALGGIVAATGKLALDVELLSQTEVGELAEGGGAGHGGSSALPHKRNPVDSVLVRSAAFRAPGLVSTLFVATQHEHERAAGAWHAEWLPLLELLSVAGGAATRGRALVARLVVRPDRMRANVEESGGLVMAESLAARLSPALGRAAAQSLVTACCTQAAERGVSLREVALADDDVRAHLSAADIEAALSPEAALGAVDALIDRALAGRQP